MGLVMGPTIQSTTTWIEMSHVPYQEFKKSAINLDLESLLSYVCRLRVFVVLLW